MPPECLPLSISPLSVSVNTSCECHLSVSVPFSVAREPPECRLSVTCECHPARSSRCEKTHNDYFANLIEIDGADRHAFGWASLQADGGIEAARAKVAAFFRSRVPTTAPVRVDAELLRLGVALLVAPPSAHACAPTTALLPDRVALVFAQLTNLMARQGLVVIPEGSPLLLNTTFLEGALAETPRATLSFAARPARAQDGAFAPSSEALSGGGLHVMSTPSQRFVEILSGVGGTGVHMALAWCAHGAPMPSGHPLLPLLSVTLDTALAAAEGGGGGDGGDVTDDDGARAVAGEAVAGAAVADIVLPVEGEPSEWLHLILNRMSELASGEYTPLVYRDSALNVDFQIPRGGGCSL